MLKVFDCSNSDQRPEHRGGGGPIENDIMRYLKTHARRLEFVATIDECDVILTNDIFPDWALGRKAKYVKRMDGVYWLRSLMSRNEKYNQAAQYADMVIFISEYSKNQYFKLYGNALKNYTMAHHWADPREFAIDRAVTVRAYDFCAVATDWSREEKRLKSIIQFAELFPKVNIIIAGTNTSHLPSNIFNYGYSDKLSRVYNISKAFLNLSYRDAATKTVCQAIRCGLPVLYANSGGVSEMVGDYGIGISDPSNDEFEDSVPDLTEDAICAGYAEFLLTDIKIKYPVSDSIKKYNTMLENYTKAMERLFD